MKRSALFLVCAALGLAQLSSARDWPRYLGADASGVAGASEKIARSWPSGGPRELWSVPVSYGFGGPAISDGKVFLLDRQDNDRDVLRVFDLKTGAPIWEQSYVTGKFRGGYPGSRTTPTVDGNRIYTVGVMGHVYCFDLAAKKVVWNKSLAKDFGAEAGDWGFAQSPLLVGDVVVLSAAGGRNGLVALNKDTGATLWKTPAFGQTDCYTSPMLATIDGVEQIVMWHRGILAAFNPKDGKQLWQYRWRTNRPIPQPLPIGDGKFFLTIGYGGGCSMIQVKKSNSGTWSATEIFQDDRSGSKVPSALFYQGHIYTNSNDNKRGLQCLDASGNLKWETQRRPSFEMGSLIIADGVILIINGSNGELVMAEASPDGYKELARAQVLNGSEVWAPLALSNGYLVLRDHKQMKCVYVGVDKGT